MTKEFENFCNALADLIKSYEQKNLALKIHENVDMEMVKIYGSNSGSLERAKAGLEEVDELAYDTAEHHPYWNILYDGSQMLKIVLERWHEDLTDDDLKEIHWYVEKIQNSLVNLPKHNAH